MALTLTGNSPAPKFHLAVLLLAVVVYLATAVYSEGYYYPDEHYQIIEFANYKLGRQTAANLPWEFKAQIRGSVQPTLCCLLIKGFNGVGVTDPYKLAMLLRMLTALLSLAAIYCFVRSSLFLVDPSAWKVYIPLAYFLWFLPYINIRFSSESWSGDFFLLAMAMVLSGRLTKTGELWLAGMLLGLSFLFRFQSAILTVSLLAWLLFVQKEKTGRLAVIVGACLLILVLGTLLDRWFYGVWTFTPWNYFNVNLLKGASSAFGKEAWWFYIWHILHYTLFPIGLLLILSALLLWSRQKRELIVWVIVPFIIIHSFIPHKETRFLFPIANFSALVLLLAWQDIRKTPLVEQRRRFFGAVGKVVGVFLILINLAGLSALTFKAAGNGNKKITRYLYKEFKGTPVKLICREDFNPYNAGAMMDESFYNNPNVAVTFVKAEDPIDPGKLCDPGKVNLLVLRKGDPGNPKNNEDRSRLHITLLTQSIPSWVEWLGTFYYFPENDKILTLYRIDSPLAVNAP